LLLSSGALREACRVFALITFIPIEKEAVMLSVDAVVADPVGLHARPAADFVRTANTFASTITVTSGGKNANAKSILQVISLNVRQGATVTLTATGSDADAALSALAALLEGRVAGG
jgi:phosphocarrier protein HPr